MPSATETDGAGRVGKVAGGVECTYHLLRGKEEVEKKGVIVQLVWRCEALTPPAPSMSLWGLLVGYNCFCYSLKLDPRTYFEVVDFKYDLEIIIVFPYF